MSAWETEGQSDEWHTPAYIFEALGVRFDVDVAAPKEGPRHVPANRWIFKGQETSWSWDGFCWMNAPFGKRNGLMPWLETFVAHANGVCLVPDRTSAPWFQWAAPKMDAVLFISPKVKFERPDGTIGKSPGTGTALMAIGARGVAALYNARSLGWLVRNAV
jgi:hypothetical protein